VGQVAFSEAFEMMAGYISGTFSGKKIFVTSSFQTQSVPLLHMIGRMDRQIPIYFLNTGFHFPETLNFKEQLGELFGLRIIDVYSSTPKSQQRDAKGNLLFTSDPDYCCNLNKIQPLEPVLIEYDVWISGVRADQTLNRKSLQMVDKGPSNTIRYHPMLNWTMQDVNLYIKENNLPSHPLEHHGYSSIGCMPCTRKLMPNSMSNRDGRWMGLTKTECGLHTELVRK
jgi:phosphoadenosine phosphosulfate reductase